MFYVNVVHLQHVRLAALARFKEASHRMHMMSKLKMSLPNGEESFVLPVIRKCKP